MQKNHEIEHNNKKKKLKQKVTLVIWVFILVQILILGIIYNQEIQNYFWPSEDAMIQRYCDGDKPKQGTLIYLDLCAKNRF